MMIDGHLVRPASCSWGRSGIQAAVDSMEIVQVKEMIISVGNGQFCGVLALSRTIVRIRSGRAVRGMPKQNADQR